MRILIQKRWGGGGGGGAARVESRVLLELATPGTPALMLSQHEHRGMLKRAGLSPRDKCEFTSDVEGWGAGIPETLRHPTNPKTLTRPANPEIPIPTVRSVWPRNDTPRSFSAQPAMSCKAQGLLVAQGCLGLKVSDITEPPHPKALKP